MSDVSSFLCYLLNWIQVVQEPSCPEGGSEGCCCVCQICYEGTVSAKAQYHVKWNNQQVVKCKYKFVVLVVHMWLQHILSWIDSSLMNCFTYLLFMHGAETAAEQGVHTKLVASAHLWLQWDVTVK